LGVTSRAGTACSSEAHAFLLWSLHYLFWLFILIYSSFNHILSILSKCMKYFYNYIAYTWSFTRVTRRVSLVEQQLSTLKEDMSSTRNYWDSCCSYATNDLFCRLFFVLFVSFSRLLYCLSFYWRLLMISLVSLNFPS
jgi:hypothetical protein